MARKQRTGVIAEKVGMSAFFTKDEKRIPVTLLKIKGCRVVAHQKKGEKTALQLGFGESRNLTKDLRGYFAEDISFSNLPDIEQDVIYMTNLYDPKMNKQVDLLMRLACINFETCLAHTAEEADITSSFDFGILLKAKVQRLLKKYRPEPRARQTQESFSKILDLNRIANIGSVVATGELEFDEITRIRNLRKTREFRRWFHSNVAQNPQEACAEYNSTISDIHPMDRLPFKLLRVFIPSLIGLVNLELGIVAGAASLVDSFFLSRLIKGYTPKVFIDELRATIPQKH